MIAGIVVILIANIFLFYVWYDYLRDYKVLPFWFAALMGLGLAYLGYGGGVLF